MVYFFLFAFFGLLHKGIDGKRVVVLGANGATGKRVVELALKRGFDTVAVTRSGDLAEPPSFSLTKKLSTVKGDVKDLAPLSLSGVDAVIFCASASKAGGSAVEVDYEGVVNAGRRCIEESVGRYVVVSSGATSKPYSPVYLFLNLFGGIMREKAKGEQAVREMYKSAPEKIGYTIVRPGGLTTEPPVGVKGIELNQQDEKSGRISRWDVAELCLECVDSADASRTTVDVYNKDTGRPLSQVGFSNLLRLKQDAPEAAEKWERRASSWKEIFAGLAKD